MAVLSFLFAGPHAATAQMGRDLYNKVLAVRNSMDRADKVFASDGFKVTKACFLGSPEDFLRPSFSAPAMLAISCGVVEALRAKQIRPQMAAGYGWGEVSMLLGMGVLSFEDALRFVRKRGEILEAAWAKSPFHVASVTGLSAEALTSKLEALQARLEMVAIDSVDSIVLAGDEALLKKTLPLLASKTVKISAAVKGMSWPHPQFKAAGESVAEEFSRLKWEKSGAWDYYSTLLGDKLADFSQLSRLQSRLCWERLNFRDCAAAMRRNGMDTLLEIGPGQMLGTYVRRLDAGIRALATEDARTLSSALKLAY